MSLTRLDTCIDASAGLLISAGLPVHGVLTEAVHPDFFTTFAKQIVVTLVALLVTCMLRHRKTPGFTLIELLCVMAIIAVLVGLMLGPISRILGSARAMQWADYSGSQMQRIEESLHKLLAGQTGFSQLTINTLESNRWLTGEQIRFLRDRRVQFIPFSGKDPDEMIVITVTQKKGFLTGEGVLVLNKGALTRPLQ